MEETKKYLDDSMLPWLSMIGKSFCNKLECELKKKDIFLSKEQWVILKKLMEKDGQTQNELATLTYSNKTSLVRLLHNLEKKELVERQNSESDKRVNFIFITKKGVTTYEKALPVIKEIAIGMQKDLTKKELTDSILILKRIFKNLTDL